MGVLTSIRMLSSYTNEWHIVTAFVLLWKPPQNGSMLIRLFSSAIRAAFGNKSVTESWMSASLGNSRWTVKVNFELDLFCIQSLNAELAEIPSYIAKLIAGSFVLCFSVWRVMLAVNGADSHRCAGMKELQSRRDLVLECVWPLTYYFHTNTR